MTGKGNMIVVDYDIPEDWEFHKALEDTTGEKWDIYKAISNRNHGSIVQNMIRYAKYFLVPLKLAMKRKCYQKVLAWQQFYGLILAFYFRLFRIKNFPDIVVMTFIYKPKKSFIGKIYEKFIRYIVTSDCIKYIVVFSKSEKESYTELFGVPETKFVPEVLGLEDLTKNIPGQKPDHYYLAAGRSNRDYDFLTEAWKNRKEPLRIICDTLKIKHSKNIMCLANCYDNQYYKELSRCYAVVVPLENMQVSSGQLVIIQAMMYGKPVIVTRNDTVSDYITDGKDGFVIDKTQDQLDMVIELLKNKDFYEQMAKSGRDSYETKFSLYAMGVAIGKLFY